MRFLTKEECRAWSVERGYSVDALPFQRSIEALSINFNIPADAGRRIALVHLLWNAAFAGQPEVLIWVTTWGIWPSGEHPPMAAAVRRALGETRGVHEAPGALVRLKEDDDAQSLLLLPMLFLWDCWVLSADARLALHISHDEYGVLHTRKNSDDIKTLLSTFGVLK
jgi:hypothetical protein